MISIDAVLEALQNYSDAKDRHDEAHREYDGYSWDYHGGDLIREVEEKRAQVVKELNAYIDARVSEALANRTNSRIEA